MGKVFEKRELGEINRGDILEIRYSDGNFVDGRYVRPPVTGTRHLVEIISYSIGHKLRLKNLSVYPFREKELEKNELYVLLESTKDEDFQKGLL